MDSRRLDLPAYRTAGQHCGILHALGGRFVSDISRVSSSPQIPEYHEQFDGYPGEYPNPLSITIKGLARQEVGRIAQAFDDSVSRNHDDQDAATMDVLPSGTVTLSNISTYTAHSVRQVFDKLLTEL